jgi:ferredoxin-NADP reductase
VDRPLFLTAGSGITPIMGMLRHELPRIRDAVLLHSAPQPELVIFGAELRGLAAEGRIRLVERHTDAEGPLTPSDVERLVPDWRHRPAWACGPVGLLDALEGHWADAGLAAQLHTERFRANAVVTGDGGDVTFGRSGTTVAAHAATPLLEVGESAGVLMRSGCRMGICYGCVVPLTSGAVRDLRTGALTVASPGDGVRIQACVSAASGPCVLEI